MNPEFEDDQVPTVHYVDWCSYREATVMAESYEETRKYGRPCVQSISLATVMGSGSLADTPPWQDEPMPENKVPEAVAKTKKT